MVNVPAKSNNFSERNLSFQSTMMLLGVFKILPGRLTDLENKLYVIAGEAAGKG